MIKRIFFIVIVALVAVACGDAADENTAASTVRPVKYITVGNQSIIGQQNYTGLAKAQQEADLSFKVSGTINRIAVKVGDRVRKGQVLATLDATDYQVNYSQSVANVESSRAQIESAIAQLESAKANYLAARSSYLRFEKLYENNSISLSDFEQSRSTYQGAEASYKAAQTQVDAAKASKRSSESMAKSASNQVSYTKITAPFAGVITKIDVEPNEVVGQGSSVIEINSLGNPDVEIGVSEGTISEIKQNQKVSVVFNSIPGQKFSGKVHEIGYSSAGTTYPVTIRLDNNDERIRPGMPASASFEIEAKENAKPSLLVPPSAVGEDNSGNFVYVISGDAGNYSCKKQSVQVGSLSDAGFEILSGLKSGDKVASAGLNVLRDGMLVSLFQKN